MENLFFFITILAAEKSSASFLVLLFFRLNAVNIRHGRPRPSQDCRAKLIAAKAVRDSHRQNDDGKKSLALRLPFRNGRIVISITVEWQLP